MKQKKEIDKMPPTADQSGQCHRLHKSTISVPADMENSDIHTLIVWKINGEELDRVDIFRLVFTFESCLNLFK